MSLVDAVIKVGPVPVSSAPQADKKRYAELLSRYLAYEVAEGLRAVGFTQTKPFPGGPGEKEFQGGLGPKKVDVSYSDERHGLLLAVSIKTITASPFGKNLKNRFGDLCTEAITLHMRFPYAVICAILRFLLLLTPIQHLGGLCPPFKRRQNSLLQSVGARNIRIRARSSRISQ